MVLELPRAECRRLLVHDMLGEIEHEGGDVGVSYLCGYFCNERPLPRPFCSSVQLKRRGPYLIVDGTLDECIREFMARPTSLRHLYEIHTAPQPPLAGAILSGEHIVELARLREFL